MASLSSGSKAGCSSPTPTMSPIGWGEIADADDVQAVVLDAVTIPVIDTTAAEMLRNLARELSGRGKSQFVVGDIGQVRDVLREAGAEMAPANVYPTVDAPTTMIPAAERTASAGQARRLKPLSWSDSSCGRSPTGASLLLGQLRVRRLLALDSRQRPLGQRLLDHALGFIAGSAVAFVLFAQFRHLPMGSCARPLSPPPSPPASRVVS